VQRNTKEKVYFLGVFFVTSLYIPKINALVLPRKYFVYIFFMVDMNVAADDIIQYFVVEAEPKENVAGL